MEKEYSPNELLDIQARIGTFHNRSNIVLNRFIEMMTTFRNGFEAASQIDENPLKETHAQMARDIENMVEDIRELLISSTQISLDLVSHHISALQHFQFMFDLARVQWEIETLKKLEGAKND